MEFHHIGKHCNLDLCNKLAVQIAQGPIGKTNFKGFHSKDLFKSEEHYKPDYHNCKAPPALVDVKVPICPLCEQPVPVNRGQDPNLKVNEHIANGCKNPASQGGLSKIPNTCNLSSCKAKISVVAQTCSECQEKFCLKHRFPDDHRCPGPPKPLASVNKFTSSVLNKFTSNSGPAHKKGKDKKDKCIIS